MLAARSALRKFPQSQGLTNMAKASFRSTQAMGNKLSPGEAAVVLEEKISNINFMNDLIEYGNVISIGDGIARVFGLSEVQAGEMV